MKILITGINGMLGNKIASSLVHGHDHKLFGLARSKTYEIPNIVYYYLDLTNQEDLKNNLNDISPDIIIHCAANVNITDCENNKEKAFSLHVETSKTLALHNPHARIIYISTDSVYDGIQGNYKESDTTKPINYYAQTKLLGEQAILQNNSNALILRTNIYGFVKPMKSSLAEWAITRLEKNNESIMGFRDVFFNPLYTGQVAGLLPYFFNSLYQGILNLGTQEHISKYDFLIKIAEVFNFKKELITKNSVSDIEALKNRPRNTTLNTCNLESQLKFSFSINEGIELMYQDYKKSFHEYN
ncbi:MAG: SDR family oxidoreductase [Ferruginibacter sp.]